jgi:hypothetical protein
MNDELEQKYIDEKRAETDEILSNREEYPKGMKVRILHDYTSGDKFAKSRTRLSTVAYLIDDPVGNQYYIKAADGSIDKIPYFRIVPIPKDDMSKFPIAKTIRNIHPHAGAKKADEELQSKRYEIEKIVSYDKRSDRYKVKYDNGEFDQIPAKNLRESRPLKLSPMEREFWKNKQAKMPSPKIPNTRLKKEIKIPNKIAMWM